MDRGYFISCDKISSYVHRGESLVRPPQYLDTVLVGTDDSRVRAYLGVARVAGSEGLAGLALPERAAAADSDSAAAVVLYRSAEGDFRQCQSR